MTRGTEQELMRLLHGELPPEEARALRERLRREPDLAGVHQRLEATWNGLEPPPASPVPPGFSGRVLARARSLPAPARGLSWSAAPVWVRAAAAAALVAGAALGIGVGESWLPDETAADSPSSTISVYSLSGSEHNLAESYWDGVDEAIATSGAGPEIQR
jgi:anti-sigma factor RsiW